MTTTAGRTEPPVVATPEFGRLPQLMAAFSGAPGLVVKLVLLGLVNAVAGWAAIILADDGKWLAFVVLVAATLAIDVLYLTRRSYPLKFLIPGTIFLLAFQVVPVIYTVSVAFQKYGVGHIITKQEAIQRIELNSLVQPADGKTFLMTPARDADGALVLLLEDELSGEKFVGTRKGLEPLGAAGYAPLPAAEVAARDAEITGYIVPTGDGRAIRTEGTDFAVEQVPTLRHNEANGTITNVETGAVFRDNGEGSFVAADGTELEPGWRTHTGLDNFTAIVTDPLIREPFLRVLLWTVAFAVLTVAISFFIGLFLAIVLDKPGMRLRRTYRALIFVPFAIPGFLVLLIWAGLLNDDFGVVNQVFNLSVPWLFDPWWARVSVILVGVWMTVPYFFLVSLGALQSIPDELVEAARVDGAGPWGVFRKITLPLLLVATAPLLVASFAFNFNDFGKIYLLTGGGPAAEDQSIAGATDILISYTYKLAFEAGKGTDYGLAAALSIVIFLIIATISGATFWKSRTLEEMR
jgi:arabinogalactan oligomer/maltooligosaccharide transport system permease protein